MNQAKWHHYTWNELKKNDKGESLRECLQKYGVGGRWSLKKGIVAIVIFLTPRKFKGKVWLLGVKRFNVQVSIRIQTEDPYIYHLSPTTELGQLITRLVSLVQFDVV